MTNPFVIPQNNQPPLDANGRFNRTWYLFLQALFARVGGATGATGDAAAALELAEAMRLGVFDQKTQGLDVRQGDGVLVDRDAAGFEISTDTAALIRAVASFLPRAASLDVRPGPNVTVTRDAGGFIVSSTGGSGSPDSADSIIATQVFGA